MPGAIYTTENAGRNWKAEVRETIDATLNRVSSSGVQGASYFSGSINSIQRDSEGSYLAVRAHPLHPLHSLYPLHRYIRRARTSR